MLLKPFEDEPSEPISGTLIPAGIHGVLSSVGLIEDDLAVDTNPEDHVQHIFRKNNAGVENAARQLGSLLVSADSDAVKMRAAETILKVHGVLQPESEDGVKAPVFNITIVGNGNVVGKNLMNVLVPSTT